MIGPRHTGYPAIATVFSITDRPQAHRTVASGQAASAKREEGRKEHTRRPLPPSQIDAGNASRDLWGEHNYM